MIEDLKRRVGNHQKTVERSFSAEGLRILEQMAGRIVSAFRDGKKVLICGNGGSAAEAQHVAAEWVGRFQKERKGLPAVALTTDTSVLTAIGNDYGFERVFERQVEGLGVRGDVLMAISTSGNSVNVLRAVQTARQLGLTVLGFTGSTGGRLAAESDLCFRCEADEAAVIQEVHLIAFHSLCDVVEKAVTDISA